MHEWTAFFDKYINKAPSETVKRCHKMDRKGMELSLNMIIYVILGLVFLGVALGLITGYLPKLFEKFDKFPEPTVEPTPDDPITFLPSVVSRGKDTKMTVSFFNNEGADVSTSVVPKISCADIPELKVKASGLNIAVGENKDYRILVWVPKATSLGQYACTLTVREADESFILEVK